MKIICQTCGQRLPKTAVMCPNCGGRSFAPEQMTSQSTTAQQPNLHVNQTPEPSAWQTQTSPTPPLQSHAQPQAPINQPSMHTPPTQTPPAHTTQYVPPVAPPVPLSHTQSYQPPMTVSPHQASYAQTVPQTPSYTTSAPLPAAGYGSRRAANTMRYAGFFKRGFAYLFDLILVGLLLGLGYQLLLPELTPNLNLKQFNDQTLALLGLSIYLLYMAFLTSSGRQATIGKIIMGLWVFGMQGQRIGFFHAVVREVFKLALLPLFFIMWFTARKQTMHDLLSRTVVLYDPY